MENAAISTPEYFQQQIKTAGLWFEDDLISLNIEPDIISLVDKETAERYQIIPTCLDEHSNQLILVAYSEQTFKDNEQIVVALNHSIKILFAEEDNVKGALEHYYKIIGSRFKRRDISIDEDITPLKRKINGMIQNAIDKNASDIHLLPTEDGMNITFRIAGHLIDLTQDYSIQPEEISHVVNIIKSLDTSGQMDTAKQNMPNQGAFIARRGDLPVDVRLSTIPLVNSQQGVNFRLLPQTKERIMLNQLGYLPDDLSAIRAVLYKSSSGMFIDSGPTGCGKTTSLYAQIYDVCNMLNEPLKVFTIEDPVELREPNFWQVQVREAPVEALSLTAPKIFKTGLRQDPDIILYGEIRDKRDAEVAIEAATTGHKLFSTVHAKDCISTISRLLDLGVSKTSLLQELNIIISQRLVGTLCPFCSKEHELTPQERYILSDEEKERLMKSQLRERGSVEAYKKCTHCSYGYAGRVAVAEYVIFDVSLRDALLHELSFTGIGKILKSRNFKSMWDKGLALVADGKVELSEVVHVIGKN